MHVLFYPLLVTIAILLMETEFMSACKLIHSRYQLLSFAFWQALYKILLTKQETCPTSLPLLEALGVETNLNAGALMRLDFALRVKQSHSISDKRNGGLVQIGSSTGQGLYGSELASEWRNNWWSRTVKHLSQRLQKRKADFLNYLMDGWSIYPTWSPLLCSNTLLLPLVIASLAALRNTHGLNKDYHHLP